MFRAMSTRPGRSGYEKLSDDGNGGEDSVVVVDDPLGLMKLDKSRSLPAKFFMMSSRSARNSNPELYEKKELEKSVSKKAKKVSKIHPLFNFVDGRLRRKATAKPEVSRYLQYLKEGGIYTIPETATTS